MRARTRVAFADTVEEIIAFAPKRPVLKYSQLVNDILMLRGARQFGYALNDDELITQGLGPREGSTCGEGTYGILPPTTVYTEDSVTRTIDGVTLQMTAAVGETDDQIFVWLPDAKALCCGDNFNVDSTIIFMPVFRICTPFAAASTEISAHGWTAWM